MNITKIKGELGCMQGHCAHLLKYVENPVLCVNAQYHPFVIFKKADIATYLQSWADGSSIHQVVDASDVPRTPRADDHSLSYCA